MIPLTPFILASSLLGLGVSVVALPQDNSVVTPGVTSTGALPSSTASVSAESATPIPASVLNSLPIIPVEGDDSSAIIQATNSSLLETHPEINVEPAIELPAVPSVSYITSF
jgi:hypothetical protein